MLYTSVIKNKVSIQSDWDLIEESKTYWFNYQAGEVSQLTGFFYLMFGYYSKMNSSQFKKIISIQDLTGMIRMHPCKYVISQLHALPYKSDDYNRLKETLPCITPAGIFRNSKSETELVQLSGYLYFDIDAANIVESIERTIALLIHKHKDHIYMVGKSVGGRGIFFYVKADMVSADNYKKIYTYLQENLFNDIKTDESCKNVNRIQFVPYDPDVYVNIDCTSIPVPNHIYSVSSPKRDTQRINKRDTCYTLNVSFLPIGEVLKKIKLTSYTYEGENLFEINSIDNVRLHIPDKIEDGQKHKVFRALVNVLMYNNPGIDLLTVQSFINYVNEERTTRKMVRKEMMSTVRAAYDHIIKTGEIHVPIKSKTLHFNKNAPLNGVEKRRIANAVNGLIKRYASIIRIIDARDKLEAAGKPFNRKIIAGMTGLSLKTVSRNYHTSPEDIAEQILAYNRDLCS